MLFKDLFADMLDKEIADDIAPYFKKQVESNLSEFEAMKGFVDTLTDKVESKNVKDR